ncbi:phosphate acyltransferase PlsX [[Mycoplasma] anseris]|uniref:Phosphate acyltransferase n=1 Tax=[Mycoplasma] anseris TaxID=92400 RepID=A0A2Z4ND05_9BACT|nr:phosphate acyltransferase PlsX [[Mycoplasma] anseris]AWX69429.1 phosphate acyltransferase PlsX [[Mycoplasma] anseris]
MQKNIIFDLLNNDDGQIPAIKASKEFIQLNPDYSLILVGDETIIKKEFENHVPKQIRIVHQPNLVQKSASLRDVLRQDSSMLTAFNLLKEDKASAILSSGDSGSYVSLATLKLPRLNNVARPAFMPIVPTITNNNILLLDCGANIDAKPEYFVDWARIALSYFPLLTKNSSKKIKIGLLNIGTEDYKGTIFLKEANKLLKESFPFEYVGFIEPNDAINNKVDIVLSDGFHGNIFLKTLESSFLGISGLLKKMIYKNIKTKIGGLLLKNELKKFKCRYDYRNIGGAFIIGLNKIVVKAHGISDTKAFLGALNQIKNAIEQNIIDNLNKEE